MRSWTSLLGIILIPVIAAAAQAAPVRLSETQFNSDIAGLNLDSRTETFESFPLTTYLNEPPFSLINTFNSATIANGTVSVQSSGYSTLTVFPATSYYLPNTPDKKVLVPRGLFNDVTTTFSDLPIGTTHWAVDGLIGADAPLYHFATFDFTVVGNSGVLQFRINVGPYAGLEPRLPEFLGFYDPSGITSVSFTQMLSTDWVGNEPPVMVPFLFDDIVSAAPRVVPEPNSLILGGIVVSLAATRPCRHRRHP